MNATGRWARRAVWATLVAVLTIGCSPLTTIAFLFRKDEKVPAEYPLRPKEGPKREKDQEIVVLVICGVNNSRVPVEFAGMDRELAQIIAKKLAEEAKENKEKLTVVAAAKLESFKAANPNWKSMRPAAIGKRLGADVVLDVSLGNINIYQPGSGNQFYQGRANVDVSVYDTTDTSGTSKGQYVHPFAYPKTEINPVENQPVSLFKQQFVEHLARDLVRKHLDYKQSAEIAAGD
ncbi:MAG: hypothetical protein JWO38_108 [Gemmataceae bacterium]|nr:hypothetical protein [Gemmataceae bacterium]